MPNTRSAEKRVRQNVTHRARNRAHKTRLRNQIKALRTAIAAGDVAAAQTEYRKCASLLDRVAKKGVIHPRNAARNKSRLAQSIARMAQPQAPAAE